jgi:Histidine kinase-, DNA gyrase B-, and HSP90-like ATPase
MLTTKWTDTELKSDPKSTGFLLERDYRSTKPFQWVRETVLNSAEADATRIEFGIEWQGVTSQNIYRRTIADNGKGMAPEALREFFTTYGGGGKPIGGEHENFGIGAKTSLFPWNKNGMIIMSWVDSIGHMIHARYNEETKKYGLKKYKIDYTDGSSEITDVIPIEWDINLDLDFEKMKPDWIKNHGTVILLLGNHQKDDTINGDPNLHEQTTPGLIAYLNERLWVIPNNIKIDVIQFDKSFKNEWPLTRNDDGCRVRTIQGTKYFVMNDWGKAPDGFHIDSGTLMTEDQTKIHWFLWSNPPENAGGSSESLGLAPKRHSYTGNRRGSISVLYKNELYDQTSHGHRYNMFRIGQQKLQRKLWLVIEPLEFIPPSGLGVYPKADRCSLVCRAARELPMHDWADHFASNMPDEIRDAINVARGSSGTIDDEEWKQELSAFAELWPVKRDIVNPKSSNKNESGDSVEDKEGGTGGTREPKDDLPKNPRQQKIDRKPEIGELIKSRKVMASLPIATSQSEPFEDGWLAQWTAPSKALVSGEIRYNITNPIIERAIKLHQEQWPDRDLEEVAKVVVKAYGQVLVAKVAHSETLKGILSNKDIEKLRSPEALTLALLGYMTEWDYVTKAIKRSKLSPSKKIAA